MSESKWKYETSYQTIHDLTSFKAVERYLNKKGREGWELVQMTEQKFIHSDNTCAYTFIFKQAITKATKGQPS